MIKFLTVISLFFVSTFGLATDNRINVEMDKSRTISIIGEVNANVLEKANQLIALANKDNDDIYLFINSPGGSVLAGGIFMQAMDIVKARGIKIKCVVPVLAASMAFSILMDCSERYVLRETRLLFHPVRTGVPGAVRAIDLALMAQDLNNLDVALLRKIVNELGMEEADVIKAYYDERMWLAKELILKTRMGYFNIVDGIIGGPDNLMDFRAENPATSREDKTKTKAKKPVKTEFDIPVYPLIYN